MIQNWNRWHSVFMLLALGVALISSEIRVLLIALILSIAYLMITLRNRVNLWSYANLVTLFRLGLVLYASWHITQLSSAILLGFFSVALTLDGLDGYLARKYQQSSEFGAYLDMETDSIFVAILAVWWWHNDVAGAWILIIGFMRYIYVLLILALNLHRAKERSTRFAKTIAVIFMIGMLTPMAIPSRYAYYLLLFVSLLTAYSFAVSLWSRVEENT